METKEKILKTALEQFNTQGVEKITTRHIAKEVGISQGNLHYHYPNKNEVIKALFKDFLDKLMNARKYNPNEIFKKENVLLSMKENFKIMESYRFLFTDNEVVWRRVPDIKKTMIELLGQKKSEIKEIIKEYTKQDIFRKDISKAQIEFLCEQFILTISTWLSASEYLGRNKNRASYFAVFTFRQWFPYLTKKEMIAWENML